MGLAWALHDIRGRLIGPLTKRKPGGQVQIELNGKRTAQVAISLEDDLAGAVYPLNTVLKAALDGELIFAGMIVPPRFRGRDRVVEINAIDPSFQLEQDLPAGAETDGSWYWNLDQSVVLASLIDAIRPTAAEKAAGVPDIPIALGSYGAQAKVRERTYPEGKQVWEAFTEMSQVIDGPDFELKPSNRTDGYLVDFHTYERMGSDKTATVSLEFNLGKGNAADFTWEPPGDRVRNRATVVGYSDDPAATPPRATRNIYESQYEFGIYRRHEGRNDVFEQATVDEIAQRTVAEMAWPADVFTVTPAIEGRFYDLDTESWETGYGIPPRFGPKAAYWMGDTIRGLARVMPGLNADMAGRITAATVKEIDGAGNVQVDLTCTPLVTAAGVS